MKKRKWMKRIGLSTLFLIMLSSIAIALSEWVIMRGSRNYLFDSIEQVPDSQTILVLGTSPYVLSGKPNLFYAYRMQAASTLYQAGKARRVIVSGNNWKRNYNEPAYMQRSLEALGVPPGIIHPDYAGFRTLDSVVRANKVFGQHTFIIVSQRFHNERAVYIACKKGLNAYGYNAEDVPAGYSIKTFIRERLARVKVFIDLATGKEPRFLGEPIDIN